MPKSAISGLGGKSTFSFEKNCQTISQSVCIILNS